MSAKISVSPNTSWSSRFGANYKVAPHVGGIVFRSVRPALLSAGGFAGVAGVAALFFLEGVPRVRQDILQKIPVLGDYWTGREIPASDNPF